MKAMSANHLLLWESESQEKGPLIISKIQQPAGKTKFKNVSCAAFW